MNKLLFAIMLVGIILSVVAISGCTTGGFLNTCQSTQSEKQPSEEKCITIINFHYDAAGNDNYNLNDEYVTFKNGCSYSIDMMSWTVKDEATHIYIFPIFSLDSENTVTLYSGMGTNTATELYWGRSYGAVWNNDGDTLYLRNIRSNLVLTYGY